MVLRDETRLATAEVLDDARAEARRLVADGFTVWIFQVEAGARPRPTYELIDTLYPGGSR